MVGDFSAYNAIYELNFLPLQLKLVDWRLVTVATVLNVLGLVHESSLCHL